jgi:hypothetical protein
MSTVWRLVQPDGVHAVIGESVLVKHQMLILNRSRRRAPNLRIVDRVIARLCSLWITPKTALGWRSHSSRRHFSIFSRDGAMQVSVTVFTEAANETWAEGSGCRSDPGRRRDEAAESVLGLSADRRADQHLGPEGYADTFNDFNPDGIFGNRTARSSLRHEQLMFRRTSE